MIENSVGSQCNMIGNPETVYIRQAAKIWQFSPLGTSVLNLAWSIWITKPETLHKNNASQFSIKNIEEIITCVRFKLDIIISNHFC